MWRNDMEQSIYYNGEKLLSLKDLDGNTPEIFFCVGNRTAGKSVYFKSLILRNFIKHKRKFVVKTRFMHELENISDAFFKDICPIYFQNGDMVDKPLLKGSMRELFYNGETCGYAVALNSADNVKRNSGYFIDCYNIFMDEFQSETGHYTTDEIRKFQSLHFSMARGQGKQYRYVREILVSNAVTLLNPYYKAMGIHKRLTAETKFLRGNGWVLEQCYNETASQAISESGFAKAFKGSSDEKYIGYAQQNVYLNDNKAFIEKMTGKSHYMATIKCGGKYYGIREYPDQGIVYVNTVIDQSYPIVLTFNADDHEQNALLAGHNSPTWNWIKRMFCVGALRFADQECKNVVFDLLSI